MYKNVRNENNLLNLFLIIFQIYILIIQSNCFKFFKSFPLLSNDIVLITDEGILKYNPESSNTTLIYSLNSINHEINQNYISFAQFPLDEGGYAFCRIKEMIYIFNNNLDHFYGNFSINQISDLYCQIIPYKNNQGENTILIAFIHKQEKIVILLYLIKLDNNNGEIASLLNNVEKKAIDNNHNEVNIFKFGISCELMNFINYSNKLLTCFVACWTQPYSIISIIFDQENSLSFLSYSENRIEETDTAIILSGVEPNNKYSIVCYVDNLILKCSIYNSETKKFSDKTNLMENCGVYSYNTGIKFINEENEFEIHCTSSANEINLIKLDKNFIVKDTDNENSRCYISLSMANSPCYTLHSSYLTYIKSINKYYVFRTCNSEDFNYVELSKCNTKTLINGLETSNNINQSISSTLISTLPIEYSTTIKNKPSLITKTTSIYHSTFLNLNSIPYSSIFSISSTSSTSSISSTFSTSSISSISSTSSTSSTFSTSSISSILIIGKTSSIFPFKVNSTIFSHTINSILSTEILQIPFSSLIYKDESTNYKEIKNITFYLEEDVYKGIMNIEKENLEDKLKEIVEAIDIGKKYEINGKDYNLSIAPINDLNTFKSTYVDLTLCEQILRNKSNISSDEILTILQIEIDKNDENTLTNQIEYAVYNEKKRN